MKALKCTPRNKEEWDAILDLADALGVGGWHAFPYNENKSLWNSYGLGPIYPLGNKSQYDGGVGETVATSEFITSMYKMAEEKRPKSDYRARALRSIFDRWADEMPPCKSSGDAKDLASKWTGYTTFGTFGEPCYYTQDRLHDIQTSDLEKRVKELEDFRSCYILRLQALEGSKKMVGDRLEKLENVVSEEMASVREERVHGLCGGHKDWVVMKFDPKASPKNIPFEIALAYAKAGRCIRRCDWTNGCTYLFYRDSKLQSSTPSINPSRENCLTFENVTANDWYVL